MKNNKPIFSHAIMEILVEQGFKIVDEHPNYRDPSKRVYFFEATPELLAAFDKILKGAQL